MTAGWRRVGIDAGVYEMTAGWRGVGIAAGVYEMTASWRAGGVAVRCVRDDSWLGNGWDSCQVCHR